MQSYSSFILCADNLYDDSNSTKNEHYKIIDRSVIHTNVDYIHKLVMSASKFPDEVPVLLTKYLKQYPEKINVQTSLGLTPLMLACIHSNEFSTERMIELLLSYDNIDVNIKSEHGSTALSCAFSQSDEKNFSVKTMELLLSHDKIDVNIQDNQGKTVLLHACNWPKSPFSDIIVEMLVSHKNIDINKQDKGGHTALIEACRSPHTKSMERIVELLLSHYAIDINRQNNRRMTALMYLFNCPWKTNSSVKIAELLLSQKDIDVNIQNMFCETALILAFKNKSIINDHARTQIEMLLSHDNIDPSLVDKESRSAAFYCDDNTLKMRIEQMILDKKAMDNDVAIESGQKLSDEKVMVLVGSDIVIKVIDGQAYFVFNKSAILQ